MQTVLYDITQYISALTAAHVLEDSRLAAFKHGVLLVQEWVGALSRTNQRRPSSLRVPVPREKAPALRWELQTKELKHPQLPPNRMQKEKKKKKRFRNCKNPSGAKRG